MESKKIRNILKSLEKYNHKVLSGKYTWSAIIGDNCGLTQQDENGEPMVVLAITENVRNYERFSEFYPNAKRFLATEETKTSEITKFIKENFIIL